MTQVNETVQEVQNFSELQALTRKDLVVLAKQFKEEDTDCLPNINGKSKREELVEALAEHMGFTVEAEIQAEVNKDIAEAVHHSDEEPPVDPTAGLATFGDDAYLNPALSETDVMEFGEDVPTLKAANPFPEDSGDDKQSEVDNFIFAELGLDDIEIPTQNIPQDTSSEDTPQADEPQAEEKKKGGRKATIPMDAPIPIRQYEKLILGIYGNILCPREEPFPESHKFAGMTHEEIKLERFNPKAHETFRNSKGHMHLLYTNVGATYLIVLKKPDGTLDPVLEVSNKGRGHLRCKQLANMLQVAYNEKADQEVISAEDYQKLAEQIELLPINAESMGA